MGINIRWLRKEIHKLNLRALERAETLSLLVQFPHFLSSGPNNLVACLRLPVPMNPDNIFMIIKYGRGKFRSCPIRGIDYIVLDYKSLGHKQLVLEGRTIDESVLKAACAYSTVSNFVRENGRLAHLTESVLARIKANNFISALLDFRQSDHQIREQLLMYMCGNSLARSGSDALNPANIESSLAI